MYSTEYRCSACNQSVTNQTNVCPNCGARLSGIKCGNCRYIGSETDFVFDRCPRCGSHSISTFGGSYFIPPYTTSKNNPSQKKDPVAKKRQYIFLLVFICMLTIIAITKNYIFSNPNAPAIINVLPTIVMTLLCFFVLIWFSYYVYKGYRGTGNKDKLKTSSYVQSTLKSKLWLAIGTTVITIIVACFFVYEPQQQPKCTNSQDRICAEPGQEVTLMTHLPVQSNDIDAIPQPLHKQGYTVASDKWCKIVRVDKGTWGKHWVEQGEWIYKSRITGQEIHREKGTRELNVSEEKPSAVIRVAQDKSLCGNTFTVAFYGHSNLGSRYHLGNMSVSVNQPSPGRIYFIFKGVSLIITILGFILLIIFWMDFIDSVKVAKQKVT